MYFAAGMALCFSQRPKSRQSQRGFPAKVPSKPAGAPSLALDTAGAVAACQFLYLGNGYHVVVALDGVFQCGSRYCKLNSSLGVFAGQQRVDQTAAKGEFHMISLNEALVVIRLQTKHQFAEGYNFFHDYPLTFLTISADLRHRSRIPFPTTITSVGTAVTPP